MKGDLHTLKKVCFYASKVMLVGEIVLAAMILVSVAFGIGSFLSDSIQDQLNVWTETITGDLAMTAPLFVQLIVLLVLGFLTVAIVRRLMNSIQKEHSPFVDSNVQLLKAMSWCYLAGAVVMPAIQIVSGGEISAVLFLFFGSLLISVVMYCLALVFRYGAILQTDADHTL